MMLSGLEDQDVWLRGQVTDGEGTSRLGVERFGAFVVACGEASVGGQMSAKVGACCWRRESRGYRLVAFLLEGKGFRSHVALRSSPGAVWTLQCDLRRDAEL